MAESPKPPTSLSRSAGAAITSAKEPNFFSSSFASGLTSRRGMARNRISSSNLWSYSPSPAQARGNADEIEVFRSPENYQCTAIAERHRKLRKKLRTIRRPFAVPPPKLAGARHDPQTGAHAPRQHSQHCGEQGI